MRFFSGGSCPRRRLFAEGIVSNYFGESDFSRLYIFPARRTLRSRQTTDGMHYKYRALDSALEKAIHIVLAAALPSAKKKKEQTAPRTSKASLKGNMDTILTKSTMASSRERACIYNKWYAGNARNDFYGGARTLNPDRWNKARVAIKSGLRRASFSRNIVTRRL